MTVFRKWSTLASFVDRRHQLLVAIIIAVIIGFGSVYSFMRGNQLVFLDERVYHSIAEHIVTLQQYSIDGVTSTAYRPPGYPLFLAALVALKANVVVLRIINFVLLGVCALLVYLMLKQRVSGAVGVLGALLVVGYPVLFYTAGTLYPQIFSAALMLLLLYALLRPGLSLPWCGLGGLLLGYLCLTAPVSLFLAPILCMWIWYAKPPRRAACIALFVAITFLIIGLWSARNYYVFRSFVLISTNSGINLLLGNSPNTTPNSGVNVDLSQYHAQAVNMNEIEADAYYKAEALRYISENKFAAAQLYAARFLNHFNYRNELKTNVGQVSLADMLVLVTYGPLLALFLLRIALSRVIKLTPFEWLLIVIYVASAAFHAIFFTRIRFRLPFDILLIMSAAMTLHYVYQQIPAISRLRQSLPHVSQSREPR